MKRIHINQILEKYWEGTTTLEEEALLREYFSSDEVAEEHMAVQPLFRFYGTEQESSSTLTLHDIGEELSEGSMVKYLSNRRIILNAAASLVVIVAAVLLIRFSISNQKTEATTQVYAQAEEIYDPEEAYEITKEALSYLSIKFQTGQDVVSKNLSKLQRMDILN